MSILNTKVVKAFCTPVSGQGGSLWTLTQKSTFPNEFGGEMRATDKVIQKNQNTTKKIENRVYNYKMVAKKTISISRHKISDQNGKITFPKEFFLEIWLVTEDCKYNYTAEIKLGKSYSVALIWGKQILNSALNMLIYAN